MDYVITAPPAPPLTEEGTGGVRVRAPHPYPLYVHEPDPALGREARTPPETVILMGSYGDPVRTHRGEKDLAGRIARLGRSTQTPETVDPPHPDQVRFLAQALRDRWDRRADGKLNVESRDPPVCREIVIQLSKAWGVKLDGGKFDDAVLQVDRAITALMLFMEDRDWDWDDYILHFRFFPTGMDFEDE